MDLQVTSWWDLDCKMDADGSGQLLEDALYLWRLRFRRSQLNGICLEIGRKNGECFVWIFFKLCC